MTAVIKTNRLILRTWAEKDIKPFAEMNADPRVMEYFPAIKNYEESTAEYNRIIEHFQKYGWGLWAVSVGREIDFIGFIGLRYDDFRSPFTPAIEIGWRLAFAHWGKGYATEGALAALKYGFEILNLPEIISFTAVQNYRSRNIMEKIGMVHSPSDDFDNPKLPAGHSLQRHVLYRIGKKEWAKQSQVTNSILFY